MALVIFTIRKIMGLIESIEVSFEMKNNEFTIEKLPTALDWANLIKQTPVENVEINANGHYDPKKSPEFHDWMVNG